MSKFTVYGERALADVQAALAVIGATNVDVTVLGIAGHEYGYEVTYEGEGDDPNGWEWTTPRVVEIPVIDDSDDDTMADTKEYERGFIDREAA